MKLELPESFAKQFSEEVRLLYKQSISQAQRDFSISKEFLSIEETMKYIGASRNTISKWNSQGLSLYKVDGKNYIRKARLRLALFR